MARKKLNPMVNPHEKISFFSSTFTQVKQAWLYNVVYSSLDDNNQRLRLFLSSGTLLGQEDRLDVGQNSTLGDGHASQELVQLLIIPGARINPKDEVVTANT